MRALPSLFPLLLLVAPAAGAAEDWPSLLGPRRDGRSLESGELAAWTEDGPPLLWHHRVGEGYSSPAVVDGRLYHFDRVGDQTRLTAFDAASGERLWQVQAPTRYEDFYGYSNGPRASPVVDEGRVFTFGVDGWLRARSTEDGRLLWEVPTHRQFHVVQNFFGAGSTPLVEGDLLLVPVGGSPPGSADVHSGTVRPAGSGLVAFDKATGEVRWAVGEELASYASPIVRTIEGRRLAFHFARGGLLAVDVELGREVYHYPWRAPRLQSVNAATPVVVGNEVLITEAYGVGASLLRVSASSYEVVWSDPPRRGQSMASHWSTPVYDRGFLYGSSGEKSGAAELRCVEWETGRVMWSEPGLRRATLLFVADHLLVLTEYGELLLVEATPEAFRVRQRSRLRGADGHPLVSYPAWSPPALSGGMVYLVGGGNLSALRLLESPTSGKPTLTTR